MKTCAFVTYNQLGEGNIPSGWHEQNGYKALVLQNTKGRGALRGPDSRGGIGRDSRLEQIDLLWTDLEKALPELDHVVVYVGTNGSERAIELVGQHLPADKVTFVGCDCGLPIKELLIQKAGLPTAGRMLCACGGHNAMLSLYERFMATGELGLRRPAVH